MNAIWIEVCVAIGLFGSLVVAFVIGKRIGQIDADDHHHLGVIQGATLGLIGLLIGFCFSGAMNRFVDRQDIVVREANAIGTAYLRADLLEPAARQEIQIQFRKYMEIRLLLTESSDEEASVMFLAELDRIQSSMWETAIAGVKERPTVGVLVLPALNEVFDLLNTRNAATRRHLPRFPLVLMLASVLIGALVLGYGQEGKSRSIRLAAVTVLVLIGGIVWATIDLDFPQRGLIQIDNRPLEEVQNSIAVPNPKSGPQSGE